MKIVSLLVLISSVAVFSSNAASLVQNENGNHKQISPHSLGGSPLPLKNRPISYYLTLFKNGHKLKGCVGTEIKIDAFTWILTAAECLDVTLYDEIEIVFPRGSTYLREKYGLKQDLKKVLHPKFNNETLVNNIGLLRFTKDMDSEVMSGRYTRAQVPKETTKWEKKTLEVAAWTNMTTGADFEDRFEFYGYNTSKIESFWCRLAYPTSPLRDHNICVSRSNGDGLGKGVVGAPLLYRENPKSIFIVGMATIERPWAQHLPVPMEFVDIRPYLNWILATAK